jgi:hypothetical protein
VQSYPNTGTKWQVSAGAQPRWRDDGRELFFYQQEPPEDPTGGGQMMSVTVDPEGGGLALGTAKPLFKWTWSNSPHLPSVTNYFTYAVRKDGQRFLIPRRHSSNDDPDQTASLTIVLNWTSLLKK